MTTWLVLLGVIASVDALAQETPSPALLVLHKGENAMAIIDPATGKIFGHVPTGQDPHELAVSADGKLAFASNYGGGPQGGNTLSVIDIAARKELHRVDLSPLSRPHGLWVADGKVYFTAEGNMAIGRYDPTSNKVDWLLGLGPEGFDLSPDGKEIWAAHSGDGRISVIDVATKKVVQTIDAGARGANRLKFTPDGKQVLVSELGGGGGGLVVLDAHTRSVKQRLRLGGASGILIPPDGSRAYVALTGANAVAVIDLTELKETGRLKTGSGPDGMAWLPAK